MVIRDPSRLETRGAPGPSLESRPAPARDAAADLSRAHLLSLKESLR